MRTALRILRLEFLPVCVDAGLLLLRLWLGLSLLILHGSMKLGNFVAMSGKFADPFGVGKPATLGLAVFGEVVGSALLVLGLFSRFAALSCATVMVVAFLFVHKLVLKGPGSGELAFIYLAGFVTLFVAGPGRFAIDNICCRTEPRNPEGQPPQA